MRSEQNERILEDLIKNTKLTKKAENSLEETLKEKDSTSMNSLYLLLEGPPKVKKRPRVSGRGLFRMFNPSVKDENELKKIVKEKIGNNFIPISTPLSLEVTFFLKAPSSLSASNRILAEMGVLLPSGRPDVDNLLKLVQDVLNEIVYKDDSLVVKVSTSKFYSVEPRTEIFITY